MSVQATTQARPQPFLLTAPPPSAEPTVVPSAPAPEKSALLPALFAHQEKFDAVITGRGERYRAHGFWAQLFDSPLSWSLVTGAVAAAAVLPFVPLREALGAAAAAGFFGGALGFIFVTSGDPRCPFPSPTSVVAQRRTVKPEHVSAVDGGVLKDERAQAAYALLARYWLERIEAQGIRKNYAYQKLAALADSAGGFSETAQAEAQALVAVLEATHGSDGLTCDAWWELSRSSVDRLIRCLDVLPADERAAIAPELMRRFFADGAPRLPADRPETVRVLSRALRAAAPDARY